MGRARTGLLTLALVASVAAAMAPQEPAGAVHGGANGQIVVSADGRIWSLADDPANVGLAPLTDAGSTAHFPAVSPDGQRIAYSSNRNGPEQQLFTMTAAGGDIVQVPTDGMNVLGPDWEPGGTRMVFSSGSPGDLYLVGGGGGTPTPIAVTPGLHEADASWSPDGGRIMFQAQREETNFQQIDIGVVNPDGTGLQFLTPVDDGFHAREPSWSPDGSQIAFASDRQGGTQHKIWVMNADGSNPHLIGGTGPVHSLTWSPDGTRFAYTNGREVRVMYNDGSGDVLLHEFANTPSWAIDWQRTAPVPNTTIDSGPASPTVSTDASFTFSGTPSTAVTAFECSLDDAAYFSCSTGADTGTWSATGLAPGGHTLRVRAVTDEGVADPTPATHLWTVEGPIRAAITSGPSGAVSQKSATFMYEADPSARLRSFECSLDGAAFAWCSTAGITYNDLAPGEHTFRVRAIDLDDVAGDAATRTWTIAPYLTQCSVSCVQAANYGWTPTVQVNDIVVTQGVQTRHANYTPAATGSRSRTYSGEGFREVPLRKGLMAEVHVFANLAEDSRPSVATAANVPVVLSVHTRDALVFDIKPFWSPGQLTEGPSTVRATDRTEVTRDRHGMYLFEIPAWLTAKPGPLTFTARASTGPLCRNACLDKAKFTLADVPFGETHEVDVVPIAITDRNGSYPMFDPNPYDTTPGGSIAGGPADVFALAQSLTPIKLRSSGWRGVVRGRNHDIAVNDENKDYHDFLDDLVDDIDDLADDNDLDRCEDIVLGLYSFYGGGLMTGDDQSDSFCWDPPEGIAATTSFINQAALAAAGRADLGQWGVTVGHELQHAFGRQHAGTDCPGLEDGGGDPDTWLPDGRGVSDGFGREVSPNVSASVFPGVLFRAGQKEMFDLMSYCSGRDDALPFQSMVSDEWISPRGWDMVVNFANDELDRPVAQRAAAAALPREVAVTGRWVEVSASIHDDVVRIGDVDPTHEVLTDDGPTPWLLQARSADGQVLAEAPARHISSADSGGRVQGAVSAPPGTAELALLRDGAVQATKSLSATAPALSILTPAPDAVVDSDDLVVTWEATDPDDEPLEARVDYSVDGGTTWHAVFLGPGRSGRAVVPASMLAGSQEARVRVRVNDGLHEVVARTKVFTLVGAAPEVRIDGAGALRMRADSSLLLTGGATGAWALPVADGALTWFDGDRRIGTGSSVLLKDLAPGTHTIRLAATQGGRTGRASVRVDVKAVAPQFVVTKMPYRVKRSARFVTLQVSTTVAAKLTARGSSWKVSPTVREIRIPIKSDTTRFDLVLRAWGLETRRTVQIKRVAG